MQPKLKIILPVILWMSAYVIFAQTITIPNGVTPGYNSGINNAESRKPLGTYFGYERTAIIFRQSEINVAGQITSIAVYCDSVENPAKTPLMIYGKERADSVFLSSSTVAAEEYGATLLFKDTIPAAAFIKGQWVTITFSTPFLHATSKAVEFIFETNTGGTGTDLIGGKLFSHYGTSLNNFQYWTQDNTPPTGAGTLSANRPNVQLTVTAISPCSVVPNAGVTISTADTVCAQKKFFLSLNGNTTATGLQYQWQDSTSGGIWISIPFADSTFTQADINQTTWFRCKVSCGSNFSYSSVKKITLKNFMLCYCTSNLGGGCAYTAIDSVGISATTLANGLSGCSNGNYILYPGSGITTAVLNQGSVYSLNCRFNGNVAASAWIDFNRDGIFGTNEWLQVCTHSADTGDHTGLDSNIAVSFTVPATTTIGYTLMRIRSRATGNTNDAGCSCTTFGSGETEDYFVFIDYPLGIKNNLQKQQDVILYPNPASTFILLDMKGEKGEKYLLELYSLNGVLVHKEEAECTGSRRQMDLPLLEDGIYFLKICSNAGSVIKKITIQK